MVVFFQANKAITHWSQRGLFHVEPRKHEEVEKEMSHDTKTAVQDRKNNLILILFMGVLISCLCPCKSAHADDGWKLTLYGAQLSADTLGDTFLFKSKYEDSYLVVLAVSKKVLSFNKLVDIELEGQAAKHFGRQKHLEFNALPVIRWLPFPWDAYIDTSLAAGAGPSYALETPEIEAIGVSHTPKLLGYLMFELAFSLPSSPKWSLVARVHHRSGANGLFGNRLDASNAVGFGIQYRY